MWKYVEALESHKKKCLKSDSKEVISLHITQGRSSNRYIIFY